MMTAYSQIVNYLLLSKHTDDNIANTEDELMIFTQLTNNTPLKCAEELADRALCCDLCMKNTI